MSATDRLMDTQWQADYYVLINMLFIKSCSLYAMRYYIQNLLHVFEITLKVYTVFKLF